MTCGLRAREAARAFALALSAARASFCIYRKRIDAGDGDIAVRGQDFFPMAGLPMPPIIHFYGRP
ncbi:hypothetical protein DD559_19185 [Sphingomonas pokkalii]|uniref:Uncharacterized protein n=1 Tax=Sphingomonas pokkalii TaxID=2175090 RepID=A0A2U0SIQ5_9SPHN|nr:hypothetical protein DD559_19185 [Sphingomonas pokkalii]